jgi:hypothetical protein
MGIVHGDEIDLGLHQLGNERDVARQPIQLGDDQRALSFFGAS